MAEQFITSFEEHLLNKTLNEGLNALLTGSLSKEEAVQWMLKDGLKYIAAYMHNNPNNKILKPFMELYKENMMLTGEWIQPRKMNNNFQQALNHFREVMATRITGGQPTNNAAAEDVTSLGLDNWEDAEDLLMDLYSKHEEL
jgi:hypothetical protein